MLASGRGSRGGGRAVLGRIGGDSSLGGVGRKVSGVLVAVGEVCLEGSSVSS